MHLSLSVLPPSSYLLPSPRSPDTDSSACALILGSTKASAQLLEQLLRLYLRVNLQVERRTPFPGYLPDGPASLAYSAVSLFSDTSRHSSNLSTAIPSRVSSIANEEHPFTTLCQSDIAIMTKKRRSLQSIFSQLSLPPDTPSTPRSSRARSNSAATTRTHGSSSSYDYGSIESLPDLPLLDLPTPPRDSPPPDLLDDDPFANLSPAPSVRRLRPPSLVLAGIDAPLRKDETVSLPPRSPLSMSASSDASFSCESSASSSSVSLYSLPSTPPPTPVVSKSKMRLLRPKSSTGAQVRPAYTRPAFAPRPSLPSLNALAQSHVFVPKVRRGRVGAQLPAEPWGPEESPSPGSPSRSPAARRRRHIRRPTELSTIRDSRMVLDGQPFFVGDGSPLDHKSKLTDDTSSAQLVADDADHLTPVPHLLRAYSDPYPLRTDSPPPATPSLYPSSPTTSTSSHHSSDHFLPLENVYPDVTYASCSSSSSASSSARHTRYLDSELISTLDYNYADAVSQLTGPPSPGAGVLVDPTSYFAARVAKSLHQFEPGTSADTVRTFMHRAADELELPLSPDSSTSEFSLSTSTSSSGHSRSSSTASTDYGDECSVGEEDQHESFLLDNTSARFSAFGIPWPSRAHTPPLSAYGALPSPGAAPFGAVNGSPRSSYCFSGSDADVADEPMDGGDDGVRRAATTNGRSTGSGYGGGYSGRANSSAGGNGSGSRSGGHGGSGGGGRGNGGGDDWNRRPSGRPVVSASSESDTSEEEEDSTDEGDFATPPTHATHSTGSLDDDVPLAQQIPTALNAQRTIRRQVRNEIDQRRRERTLRADDRTLRPRSPNDRNEAIARSASAKARAAAAAAENAGLRTLSGTTTRSQQQADVASPSKPVGRSRTKTLPGNLTNPISIGDLTKKLLNVQTSGGLPAAISRTQRPSLDLSNAKLPRASTRPPSRDTSVTRGQDSKEVGRATSLFRRPSRAAKDAPERDDGRGRALRPMRSFHRPSVGPADASRGPPLPLSVGSLGRSATVSKEHAFQAGVISAPPTASLPLSPKLPEEHRALERAKSTKPSSRRPSVDREAGRPSLERESISVALRGRGRKPSVVTADVVSAPSHAVVSPFAPISSASQASTQSKTLWQQRIFVGTMQKYVIVEIGPSTNAGEVLQIVDSQGALTEGAPGGGWMLWEVAQDFGMERPVRSFELLSDVCGSWNTDKIVNLLVIKKTLLAPLLSRSAIPRSSPVCSGYVQHEYKRGKWQKRWMELREHSLWLSKRDGAKDSVFLCSLNNFDAYYVTRPHKAPKPYVFAVKSTDSLTFFENTADYVHVFASGEGEGMNWLEKILLARSYVLHQERNVISSTTGGLGRAGTTRAGQRPAQPLIAVGAQKADVPVVSTVGFEPGSLLAKRRI